MFVTLTCGHPGWAEHKIGDREVHCEKCPQSSIVHAEVKTTVTYTARKQGTVQHAERE